LIFSGKLELPDLTWPAKDGRDGPGPLALDLAGSYRSASDEVALTEFVAESRFATLEASGRIIDPAGRRLADMSGTFSPNRPALTDWLHDPVEPGASLAGSPRRFHVRGPLGDEDVLAHLDAEFGFELTSADVYGMKLGPTPVVVRARDGTLTVDPIQTTL